MEINNSKNLTSNIYKDSLKIRTEVFIKEQNISKELEIDDFEDKCNYYVGYQDKKPVVTARTYVTDDNLGIHIQRVATIKNYRRKGLGKQLLSYIEKDSRTKNYKYLVLVAQDQAQEFYSKIGYKVDGDSYFEAGIKHHNMKKEI